MPSFVDYLLLSDAYFFLNQAKGLSDTPAAQLAKQRHVRACVLFCWQSLEYIVKDVLKSVPKTSVPNKFSDRLSLALTIRGHRITFDSTAYKKFYGMRNDLVHVNSGAKQITLLDATELFTYCKDLHVALTPKGYTLQLSTHHF